MENKLYELFKYLKEKAKENCSDIFEYIKNLQSSLDSLGGFGGLTKWAYNMEEKNCETFTFADALEWIKPKLNQTIHGGAIIFKENVNPNGHNGKQLLLKICFMGKNEKPLEDTESKFLLVECNSIDGDLANYFGNKNMVVLK